MGILLGFVGGVIMTLFLSKAWNAFEISWILGFAMIFNSFLIFAFVVCFLSIFLCLVKKEFKMSALAFLSAFNIVGIIDIFNQQILPLLLNH